MVRRKCLPIVSLVGMSQPISSVDSFKKLAFGCSIWLALVIVEQLLVATLAKAWVVATLAKAWVVATLAKAWVNLDKRKFPHGLHDRGYSKVLPTVSATVAT